MQGRDAGAGGDGGSDRDADGIRAENARLRRLVELNLDLADVRELDRVLERVAGAATAALGAERSSVFLVDHDKRELWSTVAQGLDIEEIRIPWDRGIAGAVAREGRAVSIADAYEDDRFNPEVDRRTRFRTREVAAVAIRGSGGRTLAVLQVLNRADRGDDDTPRPWSDDELDTLQALGNQAAGALVQAGMTEQIGRLFEGFVQAVSRAVDARDPTTAGHSRRVAAYSVNLARAVHADDDTFADVSLTRLDLRQVRYAALLHDVGKIGVREHILVKADKLSPAEMQVLEERFQRRRLEARAEWLEEALDADDPARAAEDILDTGAGDQEAMDDVLDWIREANRPGGMLSRDLVERLQDARRRGLITEDEYEALTIPRGNLTPDEWEDMRSHVSRSYHILRRIPWPGHLDRVPEIAWCHHEKMDGSGYPRGIRDIPWEGRLLTVCDIWDALTAADRPYRRAMSPERARTILEEEVAAGRIDGDLVGLFFQRDCADIADATVDDAGQALGDA